MPTKVTDPNLIAQLNTPVLDPDILAQLEGKIPAQQPAQQAPAEETEKDWGEKLDAFKLGMGLSAAETYQGARGLTPWPVPEEEEKALEMWRKDVKEAGGWATGGRVAGEMAQLAVPGMGAAKLAKYGKALPLAADVLATGAHGYIKAPKEGETRKEAALQEGGAALLGGALGGAVMKGLKGIKRLPEADELIKAGVKLTPGQAAEGGFARGMEYIGQFTPLLAKGTRKLKGEALESWNKKALQQAAPAGSTITETGTAGGQQLKRAYDDAYSEVWQKAGQPTSEGLDQILDTGFAGVDQLGRDSSRGVYQVMDDVVGLEQKFSPKRLKDLDNLLRKKIRGASSGSNPNPELAEVLGTMRQQLRGSVSDEAQALLKQTDAQYGKYLVVRKAGASAADEGGVFNPQQLMKSVKSVGQETRAFTGEAPLQDFALQGVKTLGRREPNPIVNFIKGVAVNVPSPTPVMRTTGRALLGETAPQKAVAGIVDPLADALRRYGVSPATAAAAYEE